MNMEITLQPEIYAPSVNSQGNYQDSIPSFLEFKNGIICPCGSRKDGIFKKSAAFSAHMKTKTHQKWLENLTQNRSNYYVEYEKAKNVIQSQRHIIAKLENDVASKSMTIDYLTKQLQPCSEKYSSIDLLDL